MMRVYVESPEGDLEGFVDECQDLDGTFVLVDDEGDKWNVNGWTVNIQVDADYTKRF